MEKSAKQLININNFYKLNQIVRFEHFMQIAT